MRRCSVLCVLGIGLWLTGCQQSPPTAKSTDGEGNVADDATAAKVPGQESVKPTLPVLETADSWEGTWVVSPYTMSRDVNLWLIRIAPSEDGTLTAATVANDPSLGTITVDKLSITGDDIVLDGRMENEKAQIKKTSINFQGKKVDGKVRGSLMFSDAGALLPAQLLPTDADNLSDYIDSVAVEGAGDLNKAVNDPDPARGVLKLARTRLDSPVALDAYGFVFSRIHQWNLSDEEIAAAREDFTNALSHWGPRMEAFSKINAGLSLARSRKAINIAEELLSGAEGQLPENSPAQALLKAGRLEVRIAKTLKAVTGKDEAAAATAFTELKTIQAENPYRFDLLSAAAEYADKQKDADAAIDYYLQIVALPMMQQRVLASKLSRAPGDATPQQSLEHFWKEKHGSLDGLEAALDETYTKHVEKIFAEAREKAGPLPEPGEWKRVLLTEVFTGTACEPCIAADLAAELLHRDLPQDRSIVLCYHNHIPAPDPLTNMDCEARATFYGVKGTPAVVVNGVVPVNAGGTFAPEYVIESYRQLRGPIDHFLKLIANPPEAEKKPPEVTITAKAEATEAEDLRKKNLLVSVSVDGVPEEELKNVRLRLAVVEDNIPLVAPNGVRRHVMVVRALLGGAKGIAAKQGVLKYDLPLPLAELKGRQMGYLAQFEQGKRIKFRVKPLEYKPLQLVAFVQHEQTKEVLQAVAVPVTGDLVYPEINIQLPPDENDPAPTGEEKPAEEKAVEKTEK